MIIFRYLIKEMLGILVAILSVLTIILLVSQASGFLSRIVLGTLSLGFFGHLILLNIPFLLGLLLPFAFYFAILLAYSRSYAENEMTVLQASGFSQWRLLTYTTVPAAWVFGLTAYLVLILSPYLVTEQGRILLHAQDNILATVVPGEFRTLDDGKQVLYVGNATHDHDQLQNVFLAQLSADNDNNSFWTVSYVDSAHQVLINDHVYLQTDKAYQYRGVPGRADYMITSADEYNLLLNLGMTNAAYDRIDGVPTLSLWQNRTDLNSWVELQWRLALVFQIIVLVLIAVPLSHVRPRQGRYAKFLPALIIYLSYAILLFLGRELLAKGLTPTFIGLWWVHFVMLMVAAFYWLKNK